jgi:LysM repeat protein
MPLFLIAVRAYVRLGHIMRRKMQRKMRRAMRTTRPWFIGVTVALLIGWMMLPVLTAGATSSAGSEPPRVAADERMGQVVTATVQTPVSTTGPQSKQQPDGSVWHVVQGGDTLFIIAIEYGVTVDQIMQLNRLRPGDYLRVGQELMVKGPAQLPTATASPQPELVPTVAVTLQPTAVAGTPAGLCILAFNDRNDNGLYDGNEELVANVKFTVLSGESQVAAFTTDGIAEPRCFADLVPGAYTVRVELPPSYTSTTDEQVGLALATGQTARVAFGVRLSGDKTVPKPTPTRLDRMTSVFVGYRGVLVGVLLVAGLVGLTIFRRK